MDSPPCRRRVCVRGERRIGLVQKRPRTESRGHRGRTPATRPPEPGAGSRRARLRLRADVRRRHGTGARAAANGRSGRPRRLHWFRRSRDSLPIRRARPRGACRWARRRAAVFRSIQGLYPLSRACARVTASRSAASSPAARACTASSASALSGAPAPMDPPPRCAHHRSQAQATTARAPHPRRRPASPAPEARSPHERSQRLSKGAYGSSQPPTSTHPPASTRTSRDGASRSNSSTRRVFPTPARSSAAATAPSCSACPRAPDSRHAVPPGHSDATRPRVAS
jgi:hypothetical protein